MSLIKGVENIGEVTVHIDPEDDEIYSPSVDLPLRHRLIGQLNESWEGIAEKDGVSNVTLHYLDGKVEVEIELPLEVINNISEARDVSEKFKKKTLTLPEVTDVKVLFV